MARGGKRVNLHKNRRKFGKNYGLTEGYRGGCKGGEHSRHGLAGEKDGWNSYIRESGFA